jgi:hypothetical protein
MATPRVTPVSMVSMPQLAPRAQSDSYSTHDALAAALLDRRGQSLTGNLAGTLEDPGTEVPRWQAADFVEEVDEDGRAVGVERASGFGDAVLAQGLGDLVGAPSKGFRTAQGHAGAARVIHDDGLDTLAPEDGP